jgi:ABC-type amino acid transport substrate-binding protein
MGAFLFSGIKKSHYKPSLLFFLASTFVLGNFASLWAQDLKIETINVAPFGFLDQNGKPTGISYEMANMIAQESGLSYANTITPYARTVVDLEYGTASFVIRFVNPEILKNSVQVASVIAMPTIIVGLSDAPFKSLADLHGKTVGVLRGGSFDEAFSNDALIKKYEVDNYNTMMKLLVAKRIDAALGSSIGLYYEAKNLDISKSQLGKPLILNVQENIINFSRKVFDPKIVEKLKNATQALKDQNKLIPIVNKYMGDFEWSLNK